MTEMPHLRVFIASSVALYGGLLLLFGPFSNDVTVTFGIMASLFAFDVAYSVLLYRKPQISVWMTNNYWNVAMSICAFSALIGFIIGKSGMTLIDPSIQNVAAGMGLDQPSLYYEYNKNLVVYTYTFAMLGGAIGCVIMKPRYGFHLIKFGNNNKLRTVGAVLFVYIVFTIFFMLDFSDRDVDYRKSMDSNMLKILTMPFLLSAFLVVYQFSIFRVFLLSSIGKRAFQNQKH